MRHILREIFERYLNIEQAAFDASPRELWPTDRFPQRQPRAAAASDDPRLGGTPTDARKTA